MTNIALNTIIQTFDKTDIFDGSLDMYYKGELEARYDYLIDMLASNDITQDSVQSWLAAHRTEFYCLRRILLTMPKTVTNRTAIVDETTAYTYCENALRTYVHTDNTFLEKYIDIDAIVETMVEDLPEVEVNGKIFHWLNLAHHTI